MFTPGDKQQQQQRRDNTTNPPHPRDTPPPRLALNTSVFPPLPSSCSDATPNAHNSNRDTSPPLRPPPGAKARNPTNPSPHPPTPTHLPTLTHSRRWLRLLQSSFLFIPFLHPLPFLPSSFRSLLPPVSLSLFLYYPSLDLLSTSNHLHTRLNSPHTRFPQPKHHPHTPPHTTLLLAPPRIINPIFPPTELPSLTPHREPTTTTFTSPIAPPRNYDSRPRILQAAPVPHIYTSLVSPPLSPSTPSVAR